MLPPSGECQRTRLALQTGKEALVPEVKQKAFTALESHQRIHILLATKTTEKYHTETKGILCSYQLSELSSFSRAPNANQTH